MSTSVGRRDSGQGLFLKHFNAGKEHYDAGRLKDAQNQLEEAYLLRPRDHKVLNLLGLTYFKQERYDKAEEVYRKLAAESPEAPTLFYNLGLISYKLSHLQEAEMAFLKALELAKENRKINFYLGSIYEKQRRFQDAIFQYRQAGASVMVRRMQDRITPSAPRAGARDEETAEFPGAAEAGQASPAPPARARTEPFLLPPKVVGPVSDVLLADGAPRGALTPTVAASAAAGHETRPPARRSTGVYVAPPLPPPTPRPPGVPSPDIVAFLATLPTSSAERTGTTAEARALSGGRRSGGTGSMRAVPGPSDTFRLLQRNLLEASFSGKLYVKQGTLYSYSGNLTFWVKDKRPGAAPALVIVTGTGKVLLTDKEREIDLVTLESEPITVDPGHLLACEESVTPRPERVGEGDDAPEFLVLEGRGTAAVSVGQRSIALAITRDMPVSVSASSVILWTGQLTSERVRDSQLSEALVAPGGEAPRLVRLSGTGRVLVEQLV
jgi:uncharacterized protein (AIM24 family)